jgi:mycothiol S-conjugate amidase
MDAAAIDDLGIVREKELAAAAAIQGYDEVILLGYRDSGMPDSEDNRNPAAFCNQPTEEVLERLVRIVRTHRPEVMLGYDAHEFYPHPDHLRIHDLSLLVFEAAADGTRYPASGEPWAVSKMYAPAIFTRDRVESIHKVMLERTGSSPYERWMSLIEDRDPRDRSMTRVNVAGFVEQARNALRAHRTQIDPNGTWFQVPTEIVEEIYPWEDFELLATRVGWAEGEDDLFAGIA